MNRILAIVAVLALTGICFAQNNSPARKPPALTKATDTLNRELNVAREAFVKQQIDAYKKYREVLEQAKRQSMDKRNLDEAIAYDDAIKAASNEIDSLKTSLVRDSPAQIKLSGDGFQVQTFKSGERAFSNRDYVWADVPKAYEGWSFTRSDGKGNPTIKAEALTAGLVIIAVGADNVTPQSSGWRRLGKDGFSYTDTHKTRLVLFAKEAAPGDVIEIPTRGKDNFLSPIVLIPPAAD